MGTSVIQLKPLPGKIIVRRDDPKTVAGVIIIPKGSQEKPRTGTLIANNPDGYITANGVVTPTIPVGSRVLFSAHAGTQVADPNFVADPEHPEIEMPVLYVMTEADILCVLAEDAV